MLHNLCLLRVLGEVVVVDIDDASSVRGVDIDDQDCGVAVFTTPLEDAEDDGDAAKLDKESEVMLFVRPGTGTVELGIEVGGGSVEVLSFLGYPRFGHLNGNLSLRPKTAAPPSTSTGSGTGLVRFFFGIKVDDRRAFGVRP